MSDNNVHGDALLLHALDLALLQEWGEGKVLVESIQTPVADRIFMLVSALEEREAARVRQLAHARHEIGNALSIAQANLEAIIDGLLEPTPQRLSALLLALSSASNVLDDLRRPAQPEGSNVVQVETFDICAMIAAHVDALQALAAAKNVSIAFERPSQNHAVFRGDGVRTGRILQNVLSNAVRYTPPGGSVHIRCDGRTPMVSLYINNHHLSAGVPLLNRVMKCVGGAARIDQPEDESGDTLLIELPIEPAGHP